MLDANIGFALVDHMELFVSTRIAERVNAVASVEHFERPDYLQELDLLDQNRFLLRSGPRQTLTALSSVIRGTTMIGLLATVHPAMALVPVFGIAPAYAQSRSVKIRQRAEERVAERKRLADELFALTSTAAPAKELRVYGLTGELIERHAALGDAVSRTLSGAAIRGALVSAAGWLIFVAGFVAGIVLVVQRAVEGRATAGEVVLAVVLSQQVRRLLVETANDVAIMLTTGRTAARAMWLEDYAVATSVSGTDIPPLTRLAAGIEFNGVTFRYPGTDVDVLRDLDLTIPAGTSVAIVGENGAGKTTIFGDLADRLLRDIRVINLSEVRGNLAGREAFGAQRDHHRVDAFQTALTLLDLQRLERASTGMRHFPQPLPYERRLRPSPRHLS